ncbi:MAG TPA: mechanosensitive ion channel family protein [Polyangiales bacterium]|nr:mechanosensitive ion channel family protein [Polyangiales bacterium]
MPKLSALIDKLIGKLSGWLEALVVMLPNLVLAVLVVLVALPLARVAGQLARRLFARVTHNPPIANLLAGSARLIVILLGGFFALELLQLDKTVTSLLAGVGVLGLALGFAFQDIAANFMAGLLMALSQPFSEGDLVEIGGYKGRIGRIKLRDTELETLDGRSVLLPNKDVFQNAIVNYTHTAHRRLDFVVGTAYCDDMTKVQRCIIGALEDLDGRLPDRTVEVFFQEFAESSINAEVRIWLSAADELHYKRCRSEAMIAIKAAFDANAITIPFPIRTLDFGAGVVGGERLRDHLARTAS